MREIIKNTPTTVEEVERWRKRGTLDEVPLMTAKHNAKACSLIQELNDIRYAGVNDVDDVNAKIEKLIDILVRGIEFKHD